MTLDAYFQGMIMLELISAEPQTALLAFNEADICLYEIETIDALTIRFQIRRKDLPILKHLVKVRGEKIRIIKRSGFIWKAKRAAVRPMLVVGICSILVLSVFLPTRILFVRVEGNQYIPQRMILEKAEACGICFGAERRAVRSERTKNALLSAIPELQWTGVNTYGCVAVISVRERVTEGENEITEESPGGIVAITDGVITSCVVTRGTSLCQPGQAVREGQLLVSGYMDQGLFLRIVRAEGEIYASTNRQLSIYAPIKSVYRQCKLASRKKFSLIFGKKRINLYKDSGIWDTTCDRMYKEYYVTLPGGFALPVGLGVDTVCFYDRASMDMDISDQRSGLSSYAESYLLDQMNAGKIINKEESHLQENGYHLLKGTYQCIEMIGKVQQEKTGVNYG